MNISNNSSQLKLSRQRKPKASSNKKKILQDGNQVLINTWISTGNISTKTLNADNCEFPMPESPKKYGHQSSPKSSPKKTHGHNSSPKKGSPKKPHARKASPNKNSPKSPKLKSPSKAPEPAKRTYKKRNKISPATTKKPPAKRKNSKPASKVPAKKKGMSCSVVASTSNPATSPLKSPLYDECDSEDFNYSIDSWGNTVSPSRGRGEDSTITIDDSTELNSPQESCKYLPKVKLHLPYSYDYRTITWVRLEINIFLFPI